MDRLEALDATSLPVLIAVCADLLVAERGVQRQEVMRYPISSAEDAREALDVRIDGARKSIEIST